MIAYHNKTCKDCLHKSEAARPQGVPNLKAPKVYMCRESPPTLIYAIGQGGDGRPIPMPIGPAYPPVADEFPACSKYIELNFDDNKV